MRDPKQACLFQAKRQDGRGWAEGYVAPDGFGGWDMYLTESNEWVKVIPETIGAFTGKIGTDGNKIFEGDVVKALSVVSIWGSGAMALQETIEIVSFNDCQFKFGHKCICKFAGEYGHEWETFVKIGHGYDVGNSVGKEYKGKYHIYYPTNNGLGYVCAEIIHGNDNIWRTPYGDYSDEDTAFNDTHKQLRDEVKALGQEVK